MSGFIVNRPLQPGDVLQTREQAVQQAPDTQGAGYGELVEQVSQLIMTNCVCEKYKGQFDTGHHAECPVPEYSRITSAIQTLTAENFTLAAGQCNVEGGLIGDDHGHFDCSLKARIATLEAKLARAERENELAVDLLTQWQTWSCGQRGASPFQDARAFLAARQTLTELSEPKS